KRRSGILSSTRGRTASGSRAPARSPNTACRCPPASFPAADRGGDMNVPTKAARATTHRLRSSPATVHWGFFDGGLEPVLRIGSGERVTIECVSGNPEWMPDAASGFAVLPELREIHQKVKRGTGNHILTGPIHVNGAEIGDVLEVRILDIALRQDWGFNLFRAYGGTRPEDFPLHRLVHVAVRQAA